MTADVIEIRIHCPDTATAERIAERCVDGHLAACAHIHAPIASRFIWKGAVKQATEIPITLKTRADLFNPLAELARALHPFETPSIVAMPIDQVTADYAAWVRAETTITEQKT